MVSKKSSINKKCIDYGSLRVGAIISDRKHVVNINTVKSYIAAVKDMSAGFFLLNPPYCIPPMAISALSIRGAIHDLSIPGGTVHLSQEITYYESVQVDDELSCLAYLKSNNVRNEWRFLNISLEVRKSTRLIMTGKSTIMLPSA